MENDAEHSFQLAMICWQLAETKNLKLNKTKILQYALVHDLVEVYAGDTDPHKSSESYLLSKDEREARAMKKIKKSFPNFSALSKAIEGYERKKDKESRLVYVMDKILPVINTYKVGDKYYVQNKVTYEKYVAWFAKRKGTIDLTDIYCDDLIKELLRFLKKNRKGFFAAETN
jgi:putative hydrolase of HD superfamily